MTIERSVLTLDMALVVHNTYNLLGLGNPRSQIGLKWVELSRDSISKMTLEPILAVLLGKDLCYSIDIYPYPKYPVLGGRSLLRSLLFRSH